MNDAPDPPRSRPPGDAPDDPVEVARSRLPDAAGSLDRACALVSFLRTHCPWDRDQTPRTLVRHLLEEAQETADAIRREDRPALEGELGDLLLNLAFQVVIGEEEGSFTRESVVRRLERKMIRRHPHLFGLGQKEDWEVLKRRERTEAEASPGAGKAEGRKAGPEDADAPEPRAPRSLADVSKGLDPLLRAHRIQERVSAVGFDWDDPRDALAKVREELEEVEEALEGGTHREAARLRDEELGDLLFSVVNLVRLTGGHAERALGEANEKFVARFAGLERLARERGIDLDEASLEAMDALWDEVKESGTGGG